MFLSLNLSHTNLAYSKQLIMTRLSPFTTRRTIPSQKPSDRDGIRPKRYWGQLVPTISIVEAIISHSNQVQTGCKTLQVLRQIKQRYIYCPFIKHVQITVRCICNTMDLQFPSIRGVECGTWPQRKSSHRSICNPARDNCCLFITMKGEMRSTHLL